MKCEVKNINQCGLELKVEVASDVIDKAYDEYYKEIVKKAKVPGFRPGKAPRHILEMHFKDAAHDEVMQKLVPKAYYDCLETHQINPVGYPLFDDINFTKEKLTFKATCEVKPKLKLKKYKGILAKREKILVEEEEIDNSVGQVLDRAAKFVPIEDRGVELGDYAICDITSIMDNRPPETRENEWVEIKPNDVLSGFAEQTVGMKTGEEKDIEIKLTESFPDESMRGKMAKFKVKVKEIKEKKVPALTDEYLKELGDYKDVASFREAIKKDIEARKKNNEEQR